MEKKRRVMKTNEDKATTGASMASGSQWFSLEELEAAREAYLEAQEQPQPSAHAKMRYAVALVKSHKRDDKQRGLGLLEDLLVAEYEINECLYWVALTSYGLGDYRGSRFYCERLLRIDPTHSRALALHQCIKEVTATDGMMHLGLVSAVVVAGVALKFLLRR